MLKVIEQARSDSLRERMSEAGCVFQFVVLQAEPDMDADEALHRQALQNLYDRLMVEAKEWCRGLTAEPTPQIGWQSQRALARRLGSDEVASLMMTENYQLNRYPLYGAFSEPPYGTRFSGGEEEAQALFRDWIDLLGLDSSDNPQVIDWTSNLALQWVSNRPEATEQEPWSDYFDTGLEWWGAWCLSIWNPRRRTMGLLIASTTD